MQTVAYGYGPGIAGHPQMNSLAIGDIHGCSKALDALLQATESQQYDHFITLGDYVNKGPDTKGALDRLISLYNQGLLTPLRGNHELKMLVAKDLQTQTFQEEVLIDQQTMNSYGMDEQEGRLDSIPDQHWSFIESSCVDYWEGEDVFCVHATVNPLIPLAAQLSQKLFWEKFDYPAPHISGKTMICGHTSQSSGLPLSIGHAICIDTRACGGRWLTGMDIQTGQFWQANQQGETRTGKIPNYGTKNQLSKFQRNEGQVCDSENLLMKPSLFNLDSSSYESRNKTVVPS